MRRMIPMLGLLLSAPVAAQAPDASCLARARVTTDSLAKIHLSSTVLTQYQVRNLRALDSLHAARCVTSVPVPPPDTIAPPPPSPPPAPRVTVRLTASDTILRQYPSTPYNVYVSARVDSAGALRADSVALSLAAPNASLMWQATNRRGMVHTPTIAGVLWVRGRWGAVVDSVRVRVVLDTATPAPSPTPTPTPTPTPPPAPVPVTGWRQAVDAMLGPIPDCAQVRASSDPTIRQWLTNWETYEPKRWAADSMLWSTANYYDRASIYYAMAACYAPSDSTRAALYLQRGHALARNYRDVYLGPNDGGVQHHWMQLEGLALHAVITGDAASARLVGRTASVALSHTYMTSRAFGDIGHADMENRIAQRAWLAALLAQRLGVPGKTQAVSDWPRWLDSVVVMTLRAQSPTTGRWCYRCTPALVARTFTAPFMDALLVDASLKYARWYPNGPQLQRLATMRRTTYAFLVDSTLRADSSFEYNHTPSSVEGGNGASPDLNLFHPANLYALYQETGDVRYRDAALLLFHKGVLAGWLGGTKQFNQAYYSSYRYVARRLAASPSP